jgi:beta-glucosidase
MNPRNTLLIIKTSVLTALALSTFCLTSMVMAEDIAPYRNPDLPVEKRVNDLLARMTLNEKIAQLCSLCPVTDLITPEKTLDPDKTKARIGSGVGTISPIRWETTAEVAMKNAIQKYLMEQTRLGIPVIFHDEGCHGVVAPGATSFPVPIGLACSWDTNLFERVFTVVAAEMRARGSQFALTPVVDICREPRWGRTDETMGEDPYLNGKLGTAAVFGLQGHAYPSFDDQHVAATLKHLVGHGQPEGGVNRAPGNIPLRLLLDTHLVPFRMIIEQAHPAAVMPSYNEVDGVPSHANGWLLQDVLRKQYKYAGLIVSDYGGIADLVEFHHVANDPQNAALRAFQAGVDMDLPSGACYGVNLAALVQQRKIPMAAIDASVKRVLSLKFHLGLFEHPYIDPQQATDITRLESSKMLALEAAQKSITLLKNKNGILPLAKDKYKKIAVIGPNANETHLGSYPGDPWYKISILAGIKAKLRDPSQVLYSEGCKITRNTPDSCLESWEQGKQEFPTQAENDAAIAAAVGVAQSSDLIILVLGENELLTREAWSDSHIGDRPSLDLFGAQQELADAIFKLGKPVVVYLMNSRPLSIASIADKADAILEGWYMGQETGHAAASILFGEVSPSGKLTISFPRSTGQIPAYYNYKPSANAFAGVGALSGPLYPFGFGLSYAAFTYSDLKLSKPAIHANEQTEATVTVKNIGLVKADEVVQLYIHDKVSSVTRPVKELKGFQRISLDPGQSRRVSFQITPDLLAFHDLQMNYVVEPGEFEIMVGTSSVDLHVVTLNVSE